MEKIVPSSNQKPLETAFRDYSDDYENVLSDTPNHSAVHEPDEVPNADGSGMVER